MNEDISLDMSDVVRKFFLEILSQVGFNFLRKPYQQEKKRRNKRLASWAIKKRKKSSFQHYQFVFQIDYTRQHFTLIAGRFSAVTITESLESFWLRYKLQPHLGSITSNLRTRDIFHLKCLLNELDVFYWPRLTLNGEV